MFPPVPAWQPSFVPDIDHTSERFAYYTNGQQDFVIFRNSTCCIVPNGIPDVEALPAATEILTKIINAHPDMKPAQMDDGNILVQYNEPAFNVVLAEFARSNWDEIDKRHQDALTPGEVLMTPLGSNVFDDFGKMALLGRTYMFMDAQNPLAAKTVRATS